MKQLSIWQSLIVAILFCVSTIHPLTLEHLGTSYGGWTIPIDMLNQDSICYCVGAGEDISFDVELLNKCNCTVYCFDPTPKAITHLHQLFDGVTRGIQVPINNSNNNYHLEDAARIEKLVFFPYGVWHKNETVKLYFPKNPEHASCSALNLQNTQYYVPAPCKTLATIMDELGHTHIDLLKLDIEGAEYPVIENMLTDGILPTILCIEFHSTHEYNLKETVLQLKEAGYNVAHQKGNDVTFLLDHLKGLACE